MAKLNKILEACETLVLKSNVSILEEAATSGLSDADVAKSKLIIHENIKYIKEQLISGRILESSQNLLASNWTQAILEDMSLADIVDQGQEYANNGAQHIRNVVTGEDQGVHPAAVAAGLGAAGLGAVGAVKAASNPAVQQAVKNQVGAAAAGYNGVQGPAKPGTGAAYAAGSTIGKVRRIIK